MIRPRPCHCWSGRPSWSRPRRRTATSSARTCRRARPGRPARRRGRAGGVGGGRDHRRGHSRARRLLASVYSPAPGEAAGVPGAVPAGAGLGGRIDRVEILLRIVKETASVVLGDPSGGLDRMRQLLAAAAVLADAAVRSMCLQGLALAEGQGGPSRRGHRIRGRGGPGGRIRVPRRGLHGQQSRDVRLGPGRAGPPRRGPRNGGEAANGGRGQGRITDHGADRALAGPGALRRRALGRGCGRPGLRPNRTTPAWIGGPSRSLSAP